MGKNSTDVYSFAVYGALASLFDEDNENFRYTTSEIDATKFFTAIIISSAMLYQALTDEKLDLFEFNGLNTRLIHQHLTEKKGDE